MLIRFILCGVYILGIGLLPLSAQKSITFDLGKAHYVWPTEASHYLSSTFGETRAAHFHAALDIKTWGRRGYEVYATRNGTVDRIAIGPEGYGKVIYLKHSDDSYSVYAHLLSFNEELQQLADSIRFAEGYKFEIERFIAHRNITIKQGEVIGYSGASGIGPPHLHFELRTPEQRPFNPLLTNLSVADNIPPQIIGISIEPLSAKSSVEGENTIYTQRARLTKGQYDLGTVRVTGPVGLGVHTFDQSNRVHNSYAVYKLNLSVNEQPIFTSKVDSFAYYETNQMFIDRVFPILKNSDKGYQRLYITDGNTLPFYTTDQRKGVLNLPPGKHKVTIEATDFFGNRSSAKLILLVEERQERDRTAYYPQKNITHQTDIESPHNWQWFTNWVTLTNEQLHNVTLAISDEEKFNYHKNGVAIDIREQKRLFMNIPGTGPVSFYRVRPNQSTFISTAGNQLHFAHFPKQTFYDTVSVGMVVKNFTADSISVDMMPNTYPVKNKYKFYVAHDSAWTNTEKRSFYHWDQDNEEWELVPTVFSEKYIISKTKSLGKFSLLKDETPPKVKNPRIHQRPDGQWIVLIDAIDNLSGIDYSKAKISVNGLRGIAEYEPEDDRFVYYHPNFEPTASMGVTISIFDKMGNQTKQTLKLERTKTR